MGSWVTTAQHREPNSGKTENRWVSRSNSSAVPATEFMLNWYLRMWVYELRLINATRGSVCVALLRIRCCLGMLPSNWRLS